MKRIYISAEEMSAALHLAGIKVTPETCLSTNFADAADYLRKIIVKRIEQNLEEFKEALK